MKTIQQKELPFFEFNGSRLHPAAFLEIVDWFLDRRSLEQRP